jgi:hypothetical protein
MACREVHGALGLAAGVLSAAYQAHNETGYRFLAEVIGGAAGGRAGSKVADIIDPPLHPRHRSVGHGVAQNATALAAYLEALPRWQAALRQLSERLRQARIELDGTAAKVLCGALEVACCLLAGFLAGFPAGHLSHLALDALTPFGLPVVA